MWVCSWLKWDLSQFINSYMYIHVTNAIKTSLCLVKATYLYIVVMVLKFEGQARIGSVVWLGV